jgi:hypothetical protein
MSTFEDGRYRWRETYFVLFAAEKRPTLKVVQKALGTLNKRYVLTNLTADDDGRFESLTLLSPDDYAAVDICFTAGEEVLEQGEQLADEMEAALDPKQRAILQKVREFDGRFDVLHFEQILDLPGEEPEEDEMLDPSTLLAVLGVLAKISNGVAIDPQSGTLIGCE